MAKLELRSLQCGYQFPLCNLTMNFCTGDHLLFYGPNGIGKSTLLKTLAGLLPPLEGEVVFQGRNPWRQRAIRQEMFYLSETIRVPSFLTPMEYVALIADFYGVRPAPKRLEEGIALLDIGAYRDKPLGKCSQGQKRRVQLLAAYVMQKPLTLCDDPLIGIDRHRDHILQEFVHALEASSIIILTGREPVEGLRRIALYNTENEISSRAWREK